ncbi:MAG: hydantoinase/oxoprolinase family protein [Chloroflexi bacterium]|nr:hydantoinase/oxoprolinase family protein [Chloroflexota bacterium]
MRISVDIGGTFTDVIVLDEETGSLRLEKVETTPQNPADGVLAAFAKAEAEIDKIDYFVHGTTLGINALLTRTGARVAIVTTKGFRDVYLLARTSREPMYDFKYRKPESLVPRYLTFEVNERMDYQGNVLTPFDKVSAAEVARRIREQDIESVAVCLLHSYANPKHELAMEEVLSQECPGVSVTLSHNLSREYREYERTSTTVIDAYVKPITRSYLEKLDGELRSEGFAGRFLMTRSGGGAMTLEVAKEQPVHLVLSGPAGGVIGGAHLSKLIGHENLITLDMGGTSLDASLVANGQVTVENEQYFQTLPISIPTIDIHTIGAGGGSIAWISEGGHLQVGPKSAGAVPGPACYDKGGEDATFTDAALTIGYLDPDNFLGGEIKIDATLAEQAISKLAKSLEMSLNEAASGIVRISEAKIAGAVRVISIERGYHPKEFSILAFGGGGPFVGASVAHELSIPRVIVPPGPANFSALGMLMVDIVHDFAQTHVVGLEDVDIKTVNEVFADLLLSCEEALARDGFDQKHSAFLPSAEMRYQGQEHTVNIPLPGHKFEPGQVSGIVEDFNTAHERQYGHSMLEDPVEIVTLRLRGLGLLPRPDLPKIGNGSGDVKGARKGSRPVYQYDSGEHLSYSVYDRGQLLSGNRIEGPAIVEEPSSTTVIHGGDVMTVGEYGELVVQLSL